MDPNRLAVLFACLMAFCLGFLASWVYVRILLMLYRGEIGEKPWKIVPDLFFLLSVFGFDQGFAISAYLIKGIYGFWWSFLCIIPAGIVAYLLVLVMVPDPEPDYQLGI